MRTRSPETTPRYTVVLHAVVCVLLVSFQYAVQEEQSGAIPYIDMQPGSTTGEPFRNQGTVQLPRHAPDSSYSHF